MSPWWWRTIRTAYTSGKRNQVIRGGRRGGKSSTLCGRVAVAEMLSPRHQVPPGDVGYFAVLSADKDQAQERLDTCHKALEALEVPHRKTANEITLTGTNIGMKAIAATLSGVVSFTCIGVLCDEMARWRDKDTGANPAKQVVTSLRPTMATMPHAIGWYVSAPWSTLDLHHEMFEQGDGESQCVFFGTTWDMNPTITEHDTHALEPDEQSRLREYAAVPMSSDETKFFPAIFIDQAREVRVQGLSLRVAGGGDFAFRRNSSAMVTLEDFGKAIALTSCEERIPGVRPLRPSETITELASIAVARGADCIACDLHYIETVRETVEDLDIDLLEYPSSSEGNAKAYVRARVLFSQGKIDLSQAPKRLLEQLKEVTGQPTADGGLTIKQKSSGNAHGDMVSALVCALWALEQDPPGGHAATGSRRYSRAARPEADAEFTDLPPADWD